MDSSTILLIITVIVSFMAFQDQNLLGKLILSPYAVVHHRQWYRLITHAFIHADWMHLIFNMIALWSFGKFVVAYFGQISNIPDLHFYLMYIIAIFVSSIQDIVKQKDNPGYFSLGASGAVSAVVFAAIFFDPWSPVLIFFIPCPGILFGVLYILYSNYMSKRAGDRINHNAHLYGSVFGFFYPVLMKPDTIFHFIYELTHPSMFS